MVEIINEVGFTIGISLLSLGLLVCGVVMGNLGSMVR